MDDDVFKKAVVALLNDIHSELEGINQAVTLSKALSEMTLRELDSHTTLLWDAGREPGEPRMHDFSDWVRDD